MDTSPAPEQAWLVIAFIVAAIVAFITGHTAFALCLCSVLVSRTVYRVVAGTKDSAVRLPPTPVVNEDPPLPTVLQSEIPEIGVGSHFVTPTTMSRTLTRLAVAEVVVAAHAAELTVRRKQLTLTLGYGVMDDSKWQQDVEFFINEVLITELGKEFGLDSQALLEDLAFYEKMIELATASYRSSREAFSPDMDPIGYEQMIADALTDLGWDAHTTKASGDQGVDVIAAMRGERVVIQCKRHSSAIGNSAVQEVYAGRAFASADHAAVVSNAEFTRSARQLAETTGVILLHHDELSKLEVRIFGTGAMFAGSRANSDDRNGTRFAKPQSCADIVKAHADRLTILRKHLTLESASGMVEDSQWLEEVTSFIHHTIGPLTTNILGSEERTKVVESMIDAATRHYPYSRVPLLIDTTPSLYEQAVADSLTDLGWTTRLTCTGEDRNFDVIAEKDRKRVLLQCTGFFPQVHEPVVETLQRAVSLTQTDHAAIVSNAGYSPSVRGIALSTGVILLRHDNLALLDDRVFGAQPRSRSAVETAQCQDPDSPAAEAA